MFRSHLALLAVSGLFTLGVISPLAAQVGCDDWPTPAFFEAATAATVQDCLGAGADPNARAAFGFTPLHRAALFSKTPEIVTALVNAGADPNVRDLASFTPLHHAAAHSKTPEVVTALVNAGADPNVRDVAGFTPLHRAAHSKTPEVVTALVNAGADLNARDVAGFTPLHRAAAFSQTPEVVTALVNAAILLSNVARSSAISRAIVLTFSCGRSLQASAFFSIRAISAGSGN